MRGGEGIYLIFDGGMGGHPLCPMPPTLWETLKVVVTHWLYCSLTIIWSFDIITTVFTALTVLRSTISHHRLPNDALIITQSDN